MEATTCALPEVSGCTTTESKVSKFKGLSNTNVPPGIIGAFVTILEVVAAEASIIFKSTCIVAVPVFDIKTACAIAVVPAGTVYK